jgi:hypothetical protein
MICSGVVLIVNPTDVSLTFGTVALPAVKKRAKSQARATILMSIRLFITMHYK